MSDPHQPPAPGDAPQPYAGQPYPAQQHPQQYPGQPHPGQPYPPQAYGHPAPYGAYDPSAGVPWSDKSRTTAGLLQLLLPLVGVCGVGRLYAGQTAIGLVQLIGFFVGVVLTGVLLGFVIAPAIWLWSVVDGIVLLSSGGRDAYGRPLR